MTPTQNSALLSTRGLAFVLGLLLVLVWASDPLLAQRGRGTHFGPRSGPHSGPGTGGHFGHFGGHRGGHFVGRGFGGSHSSFGLGFHGGDFAFGFGDRGFSRGFGFGAPYRGLGHGYALYPSSYAYDSSAYGYGSRYSYPIRPITRNSENDGSDVRPNESARFDLRAEPARPVLLIPPTRAKVYLDGRLIGIAAELRHRQGFLIDAGEHLLETVHPTFENRTFDFSAGPGETVELE